MLYKNFAAEYKADADKGIVEGYAAVFGNTDSYKDIIEPGAFAKTISERASKVKVCYMHDPWEPIGKPLHMEEDSKGLFTRSQISKTDVGLKALQLIKDEVITDMSIGYDTIQKRDEFDDEGRLMARHLLEIKLWEYSPVTWGANDLAKIVGVKSLASPYVEQISKLTADADREQLAAAIDALKALLDQQTEPGNHSAGEGAATDSKTEPDDLHSVIAELKADVDGFVSTKALLSELRQFGKEIII